MKQRVNRTRKQRGGVGPPRNKVARNTTRNVGRNRGRNQITSKGKRLFKNGKLITVISTRQLGTPISTRKGNTGGKRPLQLKRPIPSTAANRKFPPRVNTPKKKHMANSMNIYIL